MAAKNIIEPINDSNNIFNEVVDICKEQDPEFNPVPIKTWGEMTKPLFNIKELENCLDKKNIRQVIANDKKKKDSVFTYGTDYIKKYALYNGKTQSMIFFTCSGVHNYLAVSRGKLSSIYRKFLYVLVEKIVSRGYVYKEEAFRELKQMCEDAEHEKRRLEEQYLQLNDTNTALVREKHAIQSLSQRKDMVLKMKDKKIAELQLVCDDVCDGDPYGDTAYLGSLCEAFMKKLYIHSFNAKTSVKGTHPRKKKGLPLDDELTDEDCDDIDVISFDDLVDADDVKYYRLSSKNMLKESVYIDFVYIGNPRHRKLLIDHITKYASTEWNNVYKISINDLKFKARKSFIRSNKT